MFTGDPFRDSFQVVEGSSNVTVTTVNCDGQTAVYEVRYTSVSSVTLLLHIFFLLQVIIQEN